MENECITGTVEHIIFRNEDNGYTVLELISGEEEIVCVGTFAGISEGQTLEVEGTYTEHIAYGRQFRAVRWKIETPKGAEAIENYLGSGAIRGIGKRLAARIVKKFGSDALRIVEEEPERLAEVNGISLRIARDISAQTAEQAGTRRALMFLADYGISMQLAIRIYKTYGEELYQVIRENPYRLAEDINGVGFLKADRIAYAAGISRDSEYRVKSGILYTLTCAAADGSVYLPESELLERAGAILEVEDELISHELLNLASEHKVVIRIEIPKGAEKPTRIVYAGRYYYLELNCAKMLSELSVPIGLQRDAAVKKIRELEEHSRILLEDEQREAVLTAAVNGLLILTGGPGTGKTTTINEIIRYFQDEGLDVLLAAPTGRAAKRMTETTGFEASTIHRLLEVTAAEEDGENLSVKFSRNDTNPLETDAVIIDEMSMVDISLMHALLSALTPGIRLILVGDVDQLPSVGPGAVLRDLIFSEAFPCVRLTRIFRQAESSDIVVNAHRINRGEQITLGRKSRDFFFLKRDEPNRIISNIIELVRDRLPGYVNADPYDIQVLTPMRKGALGVERLNSILQAYLNPPSPGKEEKLFGDRTFRVGDKVMQTRNNYQLDWEVLGKNRIPSAEGSGIFNGDLGIIREIDDFGRCMQIEFDDGKTVEYPFAELEDLEHAYAITIHKSQGSEYPAVILPLLGGPKMLMTRNLLYTAVTRAKVCCVLLGSEETVRGMIDNRSELLRYTSLDKRVRELCLEESPGE